MAGPLEMSAPIAMPTPKEIGSPIDQGPQHQESIENSPSTSTSEMSTRPAFRLAPHPTRAARPRAPLDRASGPPAPARPNGSPATPQRGAQGPIESDDGSVERGATAPQLRRFIKSRAYVPMHELRRRFAINGGDDEVTAVDLDRQRVFVGLPEREGRLLADLLRGGDIGYELSLDPISPIVVGVYPMRPVTRA
jgi:hypothetical protein